MKGADMIKFLLSLVVVWIHTGTSDLHGLVHCAVPIFFFFSGFFLFGKLFIVSDNASAVLVSWWKKTLRLYLVWSLIFLPFAIYGFYLDELPFWKGALVWLRNLFFRGENYLSWPLWYLLGLLQAGAVIWLFLKLKCPFWSLCLVALFLWMLPRFVDLYRLPYLGEIDAAVKGLTIGLPYMVLGGILRKLCPSITGWPRESPCFAPSLLLRFFSIHIYLTHMIWVGLFRIFAQMPRGIILWGTTVCVALVTGFVIHRFPAMERFLYGRSFCFCRRNGT